MTFGIDDSVVQRLQEESARRRTSMSALVEGGLRCLLGSAEAAWKQPDVLAPLSTWHSGGFLVDIAERDALYRAMEEPSGHAGECGRRGAAQRYRMHALIESHRAEVRALAERHGFTDVRVFGSMARGDADERSDVDLLVALPAGKTGLALGALLMDVQDVLGRPVHVVTERSLHPAFRDGVLRDSQAL